MGYSFLRTLGKVGKNLGIVAAYGAVAALENGGVVAPILAPLGPWGPIAAIALQIGTAAATDYLKHRKE